MWPSSVAAHSSVLVNGIEMVSALASHVGVVIGVKLPRSNPVGATSNLANPACNRATFERMYICCPVFVVMSPTRLSVGVLNAYVFHSSRCVLSSVLVHALVRMRSAFRTACCASVFGLVGKTLLLVYIPPALRLYTI